MLVALAAAYFGWYYAIQAFHAPLPHPHFLMVGHVGHFLDVFILAVVASATRFSAAERFGAPLFLALLLATVVLVSHNFLGFGQPWKNLREVSLLYAVVFALGLVAAAQGNKMLAFLFDRPPMRMMGRLSFGIYLLHMPVIAITVAVVPDFPGLRFLCAVAGTACAAWFAHRYIEQPGILLGQRLARATAAPAPMRKGVAE